jgi:probable phosphomutase (TIGR03848 family)
MGGKVILKLSIKYVTILPMTRFLLIRHATTDAVGKHLSGRAEGVHLNEEGQQQAHRLAEQLSGLSIDAIYSSPLERATETAAPLAEALQVEVTSCEDFLEINFGEWTNQSFAELHSDPWFQRFNTYRSGTRIPGGELMTEAQLRIIGGMERLCRQHPQQTIAVVSHSDMIKATIAYYAGIHIDLFQRIEISPASVSIIELFEDSARILTLNHCGPIRL